VYLWDVISHVGFMFNKGLGCGLYWINMGLCSAPPQGLYIPHNPFIQFWTNDEIQFLVSDVQTLGPKRNRTVACTNQGR
jgi:hypothetical protein